MKKITLILLMLTNFCIAQNKTTMKYDKKNRPELNDSFEKLTLDFYIKEGLTITREADEYGEYKDVEYDKYKFKKEDSIGITELNGWMKVPFKDGGFTYNYQYKNSIYEIQKTYYKDGNIESKILFGNAGNQSLVLGKKYLFHPNGTFNKVIDHDLGWDFSLEDVLNYVESRNLRIKFDNHYVIPSLMHIYQRKSQTIENLNYWEIELYMGDTIINGIAEPIREFVKLDAKTGEILSQREFKGSFFVERDFSPPPPILKTIVADKTEVVTQKKKSKKQEGYVSTDDNDNDNGDSKKLLLVALLLVLLVISAIAYFKYKEEAEYNRIHLVK
jgi:hypothetical protein